MFFTCSKLDNCASIEQKVEKLSAAKQAEIKEEFAEEAHNQKRVRCNISAAAK